MKSWMYKIDSLYKKNRGDRMKQETKQTVFRQTKEEYEQLKNDAHAHRMNISEYLRWLIDKQRKEDESEQR